jgi:hypothetical protein
MALHRSHDNVYIEVLLAFGEQPPGFAQSESSFLHPLSVLPPFFRVTIFLNWLYPMLTRIEVGVLALALHSVPNRNQSNALRFLTWPANIQGWYLYAQSCASSAVLMRTSSDIHRRRYSPVDIGNSRQSGCESIHIPHSMDAQSAAHGYSGLSWELGTS